MSIEAIRTSWPLFAGPLDAPLAWRGGTAVSRRDFLQQAYRLAALLPEGGPLLAMTADRYLFTLALGAAVLRGQAMLMPPNHTPETVRQLRARFPRAYVLADGEQPELELPTLAFSPLASNEADDPQQPRIAGEQVVAHVLTSGSTGQPVPHDKRWDLLVASIRAETRRLAEHLGQPDLRGVTVVGTMPAHHMFGFESTVLLPLLGGGAFAAQRPFYPRDIADTLAALPRPRVLVTTPLHLKTLLDAGIALPEVDLTLSATAPLSPQLAARAEAALAAPLLEIYGCTEAGQVASRRTSAGAEWQTLDGLALSGQGEHAVIAGGHVPQPTQLADILEVLAPDRFLLLGRANDLVNIAGKRSSLAYLNHHLNSIPGVRDGAFWLPPESDEQVVRLVAIVVAPDLDSAALLAALRQRLDAAFLPRRILRVDALPRDPTGKLPETRLAELANRLLAETRHD
jgi:acyl-coenzyme A synthetase/AMP-(fatty) acid ligase